MLFIMFIVFDVAEHVPLVMTSRRFVATGPSANQFVTVKLDALVIDSCSTEMQVAEKSTRTVKVTDPAGSDGKSYFVVKSLKEVQLRAKKGVSYAVTLNVADCFGNKSSKTITVPVP